MCVAPTSWEHAKSPIYSWQGLHKITRNGNGGKVNGFCHFLTGRHFEEMTKTRRAESVIVNLEQTYRLGNRPPCFLILAGVPAGGAVARTLTPTGARQLIGCTGSVYFRVADDANSLMPNNQTHTLRVRATCAKHNERLFIIHH